MNWVEQFSSRPLPVLRTTRDAVRQLLQREHLSKTRYGEAFRYDPGLCLPMVSLANQQRAQKGRFLLTNLENVLSHHSENSIRQQVEQAVTLESLALPPRNVEGYLACMAQACHASLQARDWADARKAHEPENVELAALFQFLAELYLWAYGGDVMLRLQHRCRVENIPAHTAETQLLGCSMRNLSAQLAEHYHLPELVMESLRSDYNGFTLGTGIALAAWLAQLSGSNWYGSAMDDCIRAIAEYRGHGEAEVETRMHRLVVAKTGVFQQYGLTTPARLIPMLADDNYIDPLWRYGDEEAEEAPAGDTDMPADAVTEAPMVSKAVEAASGSAEAVSQTRDDIMQQLLQRLQQSVRDGASVGALIQQSVDGIATLGMDAVVFLVRVPKQSLLLGKFVASTPATTKLAVLKISLDKPHLLTRLLEKPLHLWVKPDNAGRYQGLLPEPVKLALPSRYFVTMSVFAGQSAVGLMLAAKSRGDISEAEDRAFQSVCRLLSKAIVLMRGKKKR